MDACTTNFLSDDPTTEDRFGSRQPLAEALVDIFHSVPGGKTIGLVGAWGSGKSSVIRAAQEQLEESAGGDADYQLVTFDAWSHEGDPLRRAFLETLEKRLNTCEWLGDTDVSDKLACRTTLQIKEEGIELTPSGEIAFASVIVSAAGLAYVGVINRLGTVDQTYLLVLAACSVALPLLVMLGVYMRAFFTKNAKKSKSDVLGLLMKKPTTAATTETSSTPDPTSVDFEELFHGMIGKVLANPRRRLVLVIDNLDRIDSDDAQSVWSTMRTFFDGGVASSGTYLNRLWLVVPFARDSIPHLVGSAAIVKSSAMDKVFDLVLDVPPPISSSWREYLLEQLTSALPTHADSGDLHTIYRLYGLQDREEWPLTPRAAKRFINKLVAVHRLRMHEIALPSQAFYVLQGGKELDLVRAEVIPRAVEYLLGADWRRDYAALFYGLPHEIAIEVVIEPQLVRALEQGDTETLSELRMVSGFTPLLENVIAKSVEDWRTSKPLAGVIAAGALASLDLDTSDHPVAAVWEELRRLVAEISAWQGLNAQVGGGLVAIVRHVNDQRAASSQLGEGMSRAALDGVGTDKWLDAVLVIDSGLADLPEAREGFRSNLRVPGDGVQYLEVLKHLAGNATAGTGSSLRLHPASSAEDVQSAVIDLLRAASLEAVTPTLISLLRECAPDVDIDVLRSVAAERLQNANMPSEEVAVVVRVLRQLVTTDSGMASEEVAASFRDGRWSRIAWNTYSRSEHAAVADLYSMLLDAVAHGFSLAEVVWTGDAQGVYRRLLDGNEVEIGEHIVEWANEDVEWLLELLTDGDDGQQAFAAKVFSSAVARDTHILDLMGPECALLHYDALSKALNYGMKLPNWLVGTAGDDPIIEKGYQIGRSCLYRDVLKTGRATPSFEEFMVSGLQAYQASTWASIIEKNTCSMECLRIILRGGRTEFLGGALSEAIVRTSWSPENEQVQVRAKACVPALTPGGRKMLADQLAARLQNDSASTRGVVANWGPLLLESSVFSAAATQFIDGAATQLVDAGTMVEARWLAQALDHFPDIVQNASGRARADLKRLVKKKRGLARTASGTRQAYDAILKVLG